MKVVLEQQEWEVFFLVLPHEMTSSWFAEWFLMYVEKKVSILFRLRNLLIISWIILWFVQTTNQHLLLKLASLLLFLHIVSYNYMTAHSLIQIIQSRIAANRSYGRTGSTLSSSLASVLLGALLTRIIRSSCFERFISINSLSRWTMRTF